jgi:DNA-binding response OmpR family regulator
MANRLDVQIVPMAEVAKTDEVALSNPRRKILIVDDEQVIADTLAIILSKSGFDTFVAYDGASALALAYKLAPDLIVSDVVMPKMSGVDLAIAVTQTMPECRILLFSGQAATVDLLEEARQSGHNFTTLTKPVHPTDLLRRISECLTPTNKAYVSPGDSLLHEFLPV